MAASSLRKYFSSRASPVRSFLFAGLGVDLACFFSLDIVFEEREGHPVHNYISGDDFLELDLEPALEVVCESCGS